jgi:NADH:ubiquinone oxidoreductase subunit B-like Fe-S oxidoreductase
VFDASAASRTDCERFGQITRYKKRTTDVAPTRIPARLYVD